MAMPDPREGTAGRHSLTAGQPHQPFDDPEAQLSLGGHPHGKASSWAVVGVVVAAFLAGGAALIVHLWWLLALSAGVVALCVPAALAVRMMDDTVIWGAAPGGDGGRLPARAREHEREQDTARPRPHGRA